MSSRNMSMTMKDKRLENEAGVAVIFGTRPELIKLAPVIKALKAYQRRPIFTINTGQQADLVPPHLSSFGIVEDQNLSVMKPNQSINTLLARTIAALDIPLAQKKLAAVVVQGDTTSALAGALAAAMKGIPVVHVEAGLRSGRLDSPFPEEANRRLITSLATLHCAATSGNVTTLRTENIPTTCIELTGNPVVDSLLNSSRNAPSAIVTELLAAAGDRRIALVTLHRRENFGPRLEGYLQAIKREVEKNNNLFAILPVHPNPICGTITERILADIDRVCLTKPLSHQDFIELLRHAFIVLSDSGGVQEEIATLGRPLLILREVTERPEVIDAGFARLASRPRELSLLLDAALAPDSWCTRLSSSANPFGDGRSGPRIASAIMRLIGEPITARSD